MPNVVQDKAVFWLNRTAAREIGNIPQYEQRFVSSYTRPGSILDISIVPMDDFKIVFGQTWLRANMCLINSHVLYFTHNSKMPKLSSKTASLQRENRTFASNFEKREEWSTQRKRVVSTKTLKL